MIPGSEHYGSHYVSNKKRYQADVMYRVVVVLMAISAVAFYTLAARVRVVRSLTLILDTV